MKKSNFFSVLLLLAVCSGSCIIGSCSKNDIDENAPAGNDRGSIGEYGSTDGHEWVDLGLPSGTLWATCNVGASGPEEYGDYFAWGETQGRESGKTHFSWESYKFSYNSTNLLTKYCLQRNCGYEGYVDGVKELSSGDDAATEKWGGSWQTPSPAQIAELIDGSNIKVIEVVIDHGGNAIEVKRNVKTVKWVTRNGVNGLLIRNEYTDKELFLPAAGYCQDSDIVAVGTEGGYWSRSIPTAGYPGSASSLFFSSRHPVLMNYYYRYFGRTIRPVRK